MEAVHVLNEIVVGVIGLATLAIAGFCGLVVNMLIKHNSMLHEGKGRLDSHGERLDKVESKLFNE